MKFFNKLTAFLIIVSFVFSGEAFARRSAAERQIDREERAAQRSTRRMQRAKATRARTVNRDRKRIVSRRTQRNPGAAESKRSIRAQRRVRSTSTPIAPRAEKSRVVRRGRAATPSPVDNTKKAPVNHSRRVVIRSQDIPQDLKNDMTVLGIKETAVIGKSPRELRGDLVDLSRLEHVAQYALVNYELEKALGHDVSSVSEMEVRRLETMVGRKNNGVGMTQRFRNFLRDTYGFQG